MGLTPGMDALGTTVRFRNQNLRLYRMSAFLQHRPVWSRYAVVVLSLLFSLALRQMLHPWLGERSPFLLFIFAITLSAWYGGLAPGLASTLFGAVLGYLFFARHDPDSLLPGSFDVLLQLVLFLATGIVVSALSEALHAARRGAEESLRSLRRAVAENETLMDLVPVGILVAHDPQCHTITGNRASREMLRLDTQRNASLTAPDADRPQHFRVLREGVELAPEELPMQYAARTGDEVRALVLDVAFNDGETRHLLEYASPLYDESGAIRGSLGVFVDITERRKMEEDLRRTAEELAQTDKARNEFLAMLAHELRNPLAAISNAVEVLRYSTDTSDAHERSRRILERQVAHMVHMVEDLLDVARMSNGRMLLRRDVMELNPIVSNVVETARASFQERGHELTLTLCPESVWVDVDPIRLEQILANLLNNAAKYTEPPGQIFVTTERRDKDVQVRVRDTGIGIDPALLPRVFDLFTQADTSLDRSQGGLGIGLTLARRVVEMHGGTITACSDGPGCGSEFVVTLPLAAGLQSAPSSLAAPETGSGKWPPARLLLVEDNADAAETLAQILTAWGLEVRAVGDGPSAITVAADFCPHLVLLDIGLPGMDGFEVARRLKRDERLDKPFIVALSGYVQPEAGDGQANFDAHLVKPVDLDHLREVLSATLSAC